MDWLIRCEAIAGSASFVVNGYPEAQMTTLGERSSELRLRGSIGREFTILFMKVGIVAGRIFQIPRRWLFRSKNIAR